MGLADVALEEATLETSIADVVDTPAFVLLGVEMLEVGPALVVAAPVPFPTGVIPALMTSGEYICMLPVAGSRIAASTKAP